MSKNKNDYFKELKNISSQCVMLIESESLFNDANFKYDITSELINITEKLRKEYFTPIDREDIFKIAYTLSCIHEQLKLFIKNKTAININADYSLQMNNLYSAVKTADSCIDTLISFPGQDLLSVAYNALNILKTTTRCNNKHLTDCLNLCRDFFSEIIYIYLKNT